MGLWWLSFADASKPKGQTFLGGCIVEAKDFKTALRAAHIHCCNPGGECQGSEFVGEVPEEHKNKLFRTVAEIEAVFGEAERF